MHAKDASAVRASWEAGQALLVLWVVVGSALSCLPRDPASHFVQEEREGTRDFCRSQRGGWLSALLLLALHLVMTYIISVPAATCDLVLFLRTEQHLLQLLSSLLFFNWQKHLKLLKHFLLRVLRWKVPLQMMEILKTPLLCGAWWIVARPLNKLTYTAQNAAGAGVGLCKK